MDRWLALADAVAPQPVSFATAPEGARIYISDYVAAAGDDLADWQLLGQTPLTANDPPRWGYYRVRAVKEGFSTAERTHFTGPGQATTVDPPNKEQMQEGLNFMQKYADTVQILPTDSKSDQEFKQSVKDTVEYLKTEQKLKAQPAKAPTRKRT